MCVFVFVRCGLSPGVFFLPPFILIHHLNIHIHICVQYVHINITMSMTIAWFTMVMLFVIVISRADKYSRFPRVLCIILYLYLFCIYFCIFSPRPAPGRLAPN